MYKEEIFGPVAPIYSFSDKDNIYKLANDTMFGLSAYVYTNSLSRAWESSLSLESANICINSTNNYIGSPWGGHKESGIHGASGRLNTLEQYFETKSISMTML